MADTNGWEPQKLKMMYKQGLLLLNDNASSFLYENDENTRFTYIKSLNLHMTYPSGKTLNLNHDAYLGKLPKDENKYKNTDFEISLDEIGEYKIELNLIWHGYPQGSTKTTSVKCVTYIYVNPEDSSVAPYTLADTIERLLAVTPLRTKSEPSKYVFDPVQLEEYRREESPEFAFTGHTLFEALLQIAQYKGCFPVLKGNIISFRKMWNGTRLAEADLPPPIEEISSRDINQYCTYLETEVQNLVGVNDSGVGSIVEPYDGGYKTTRSSNGSQISQDTAVISTDYNMYQLIKQEVGFLGDELPSNNDISDYVYESGDYFALTDMTAAYPASKAYALQWQQMGRNITELAHRIQCSSASKSFKEPAMANIIQAKTGIEYGTGIVDYIQKMIGIKDEASFADLMFRTTYIPVINSRIKQYKDYYGDFHYDGSLKYNQTAELVDSEMYGQHLKELLRKLGNVTKRKIYIFDKIDDVPDTGTVVDGYSVYDVNMSLRENKVIATISYVKYAELSRYIGVKNAWKDSDVSTDKCYNRQVSYNEFLMFTHDPNKKSSSLTVTNDLLNNLLPHNGSGRALTCVQATGYTADKAKLNTVLLPVVSLAMGNSIMFQWQYQNNYSAGYMSEKAPDGATSILSGTRYNRAQKAVKYADPYGKLETYDFSLLRTGPNSLGDGSMLWVENPELIEKIFFPIEKLTASFYLDDRAKGYRIRVTIPEGESINADVLITVKVTDTDGRGYGFKLLFTAKRYNNNYFYVDSEVLYNNVTGMAVDVLFAETYDLHGSSVESDDGKRSVFTKRIAHSLPLKPNKLRRPRDMEEWKGEDYVTVNDLVVKKNSCEALSFSVQLHFCTDNENFIVGSGLSNFCPLVGGYTVGNYKIYGFKDRINIFDRRVSVAGAVQLNDISVSVNEENKCVEITLPPEINEYNAWAVVGKDKHDNHQIIFGENRPIFDENFNFNIELYLLPLKENIK